MGDLSKHFSAHEFCCKGKNCCDHSVPMHPMIIPVLEHLRELLRIRLDREVPLAIRSGFRCRRYNGEIDGAKDSRHSYGDAVDIQCPEGMSVNLFAVFTRVARNEFDLIGGTGLYNDFVHMDFRGTEAHWDMRNR